MSLCRDKVELETTKSCFKFFLFQEKLKEQPEACFEFVSLVFLGQRREVPQVILYIWQHSGHIPLQMTTLNSSIQTQKASGDKRNLNLEVAVKSYLWTEDKHQSQK